MNKKDQKKQARPQTSSIVKDIKENKEKSTNFKQRRLKSELIPEISSIASKMAFYQQ